MRTFQRLREQLKDYKIHKIHRTASEWYFEAWEKQVFLQYVPTMVVLWVNRIVRLCSVRTENNYARL